MAKPTLMQRYYLFQIAWMRWFGVVFASAAILITASNLPWLVRSRDLKLIATNVGGGAGFLLIGLALYLIGTSVQRRYRAHIAQQID
jgi:amino acid transporter